MRVFFVLFNIVVLVFFMRSVIDNDQVWSRESILLILLLFVGNLFIGLYLRRKRAPLAILKHPMLRRSALVPLTFGIWLNYGLIAAGVVVLCVGVIELSWRIVFLGSIGITIASCRLWVSRITKGHIEREE